jgi:nicotinamide-nucleotide amidase
MAEASGRVREALKSWLVAEGDATLEGNLGRELRSRGLSLAVAESATGGMVGERITRVPGSSDYFKGGVIAYTYEVKEALLGVPGELLREKGAVNEEVAVAMARGARDRLKAGIGVAVTGVAGPGSGGEKQPVGTIAFGIVHREGASSWIYRLPGNREMVREAAATVTLALTYFFLRGEGPHAG